jgi:hypothetical protein
MSALTDAGRRVKGVRLPDGSRSVQSPWVWRGFFLMSLIALGLCISFIAGHEMFFAGAWALITIGWFGLSMWLWRKHTVYDDADWKTRQRDKKQESGPAAMPRRGGHVGRGGEIT